MTTVDRNNLDKSLSSGLRPLYLLLGTETYLRDEAALKITNAALRGTLLREFNESSFSLLTISVKTAIAAAEQLPMMSERRVVRIKDFVKLREAEEEILISYVNNPAPSTVMILIADELDKRKKATRTLLDNSVVVDFPPLRDGEAKALLRVKASELKMSVDGEVLNEIIRLVGTDVQTLSNELEKLASAAADTGKITDELVYDLIGRSRELSNFELADHLLSRNRKRALETLHRLLDDGAEPVMLIGLLASNYHRLALGKFLLSRGTPAEVFQNISMPPFKRDAYISNLRRIDENKIISGIQRIAAADLAIKTSQATPRLQIEMLVCELTS